MNQYCRICLRSRQKFGFMSSIVKPRRYHTVNLKVTEEDNSKTNNESENKSYHTVIDEEVKKFSLMSKTWWDPEGFCKPLHSMNDLRVPLVRDGLIQSGAAHKEYINSSKPLKGLNILDIGCGGGILCEPLARLGANVTGVDASKENINIAEIHARKDQEIISNIKYIHGTIEEHIPDTGQLYDAIIASEVLEHVAEPQFFLETCSTLIKPNGSFFITTIGKSTASWLGAIVAAEYILKLLPQGTHDWNKFISAEELIKLLELNSLSTRLVHGMCYIPFINKWQWTSNSSVNYALHAIKEK